MKQCALCHLLMDESQFFSKKNGELQNGCKPCGERIRLSRIEYKKQRQPGDPRRPRKGSLFWIEAGLDLKEKTSG